MQVLTLLRSSRVTTASSDSTVSTVSTIITTNSNVITITTNCNIIRVTNIINTIININRVISIITGFTIINMTINIITITDNSTNSNNFHGPIHAPRRSAPGGNTAAPARCSVTGVTCFQGPFGPLRPGACGCMLHVVQGQGHRCYVVAGATWCTAP